MQPELTDIELLSRLKLGDELAFDHVYGLLYKPLCFFAEKMVNDSNVAEDIVTDCFVKLLEKKPDFETLLQLKSYLYNSVRNACIDEIRMQKRHQQVHHLMEQEGEPTVEEAGHALIMSEVLFAVYQALNKLPEKYKEVVKLSLLEGLSNSEIALKTGLAYQTIRNHKSEGVKLLRTSLLNNRDFSVVVLSYVLLFLNKNLF